MHVVAVLFSNCDVYCLKVNCTVGEVNTEVRERLRPYVAVQVEHQGLFRFMLFAETELMIVSSGVANALYALLAFHYVMHYEYCGHVVKCLECIERFFCWNSIIRCECSWPSSQWSSDSSPCKTAWDIFCWLFPMPAYVCHAWAYALALYA